MLTRLRVQGFRNLRDVDLHFGSFTCVAGANGAGKSNLFDAIALLGSLATKPVVDTLLSVRGSNGRVSKIASLFSLTDGGAVAFMLFTADMILPRTVRDDFNRDASPTATFVEYSVKLCFDPNRPSAEGDRFYIEHETLKAESSSDASRWLPFEPESAWVKEHVRGPGPRTRPFIDTQPGSDGAGQAIILYGEGGRRGRPFSVPAKKSSQTVLCGVNAITYPTALATRNEMRSWRLLQLEPSALRQPDELHGSPRISAIGEHLPSALLRVGDFAEVTRRLGELMPNTWRANAAKLPITEVVTQGEVEDALQGTRRPASRSPPKSRRPVVADAFTPDLFS